MLEIRHENMDDLSDTREAYNEIYDQEGIFMPVSFYLWILSLLKSEPGKALVDISCGQGRLVTLAQQSGLNAIGIDFAMQGVRKGHLESPQSGWVVGDDECLPSVDQCADYMTHIGSLEHYLNPELGVSEIARILKPDGRACILLPNAFGLLGNIRYVWATGDIFDDGQSPTRLYYLTRAEGFIN